MGKYDGELVGIVLVFTIPTDASDAWVENDLWLDDFHREASMRLESQGFSLEETEGPLINGALACTIGKADGVHAEYLARHWKIAHDIIKPVFQAVLSGATFR